MAQVAGFLVFLLEAAEESLKVSQSPAILDLIAPKARGDQFVCSMEIEPNQGSDKTTISTESSLFKIPASADHTVHRKLCLCRMICCSKQRRLYSALRVMHFVERPYSRGFAGVFESDS